MSMMSDKIAAFLAASRKKNNQQTTSNTTTIHGYAASDSADGKVEVYIPGADVIQPDDADNTVGNTVSVPIIGAANEGDPITILGVGNGVADTPIVLGGAGFGDKLKNRISSVAAAATAAIEHVAEEAQAAIGAINQHFWTDGNGVHVTSEEDDATTGPNLLANSAGVLLRDGDVVMSAQTPSGFAVYDGNGNTPGNVIAMLGSLITLGKTGEQQLVLDQDAFELLNSSGVPYFHVGYSDDAIGPGGTTQTAPFILFDENGSVSTRTIGAWSVALGYGTQADAVGAVALGLNAAATGASSIAAGNNVASGSGSAAFGNNNIAAGYGQLACGNYCEEDQTGYEHLFAVGDGNDASHRKNAFTVKTDGRLSTMHGDVMAAAVLYESNSVELSKIYYDLQPGLEAAQLASVEALKKLEIYYYDNLGNKGSVAIWHPKHQNRVLATTTAANTPATAFVVRSRLFEVAGDTAISAVYGWSAEYAVNTSSQATALTSGDYIGIQAIIGYY